MKNFNRSFSAALCALGVSFAGAAGAESGSGIKAELRADSGIVLPNLDDDTNRCTAIQGLRVSACNDATDNVINGSADLADLTPLSVKHWRNAPEHAGATVTIGPRGAGKARLFIRRGQQWTAPALVRLTARELRAGVDLRLEATDVVRNKVAWDGRIDVTLTVTHGSARASDRLQFKVAPLIVSDDLSPLRKLYIPSQAWAQDDPNAGGARSRALSRWAAARGSSPGQKFPYLNILEAAAPKHVKGNAQRVLPGAPNAALSAQTLGLFASIYKAFRDDFAASVRLVRPPAVLEDVPTSEDPWVQDMWQMTYAVRPGGRRDAQVMHIALRSAQPQRFLAQEPLLKLLGPDIGVVEQWADDESASPAAGDYSMNSSGNFGAIPPYSHQGKRYPQGRMLYGAGFGWMPRIIFPASNSSTTTPGGGDLMLVERKPDETFMRLLADQQVPSLQPNAQQVQPPLAIDTAWLFVGHIDEVVAFVGANTVRGWKVVVPDPLTAWRMMLDLAASGHGNTKFRSRLEPWASAFAEEDLNLTVQDIVREQRIAQAQLAAHAKIAGVIATLKRETGIDERDLIRVPVLFDSTFFNERSYTALTPNAVNLVTLDRRLVAIAKQHGPLLNGQDVFEQAIEQAFAAEGIAVSWVEDYIQAHVGNGEIHCQSNALREPRGRVRWMKD